MQYRDSFPHHGQLEWIGIRPHRGADMKIVASASIDQQGLKGDFFSGPEGAPRAVTLIQAEHLPVVAAMLRQESLSPHLLRRNLVISGINLQSLKQRTFKIGDAVLFGTGNCAPCGQMETQLGEGGFNAMRGHGGITARVILGGQIARGDQVRMLEPIDVESVG